MAKKSVSELEKRTVNALRIIIGVNPGVETKLLRGYLALQLTTENGRLPRGRGTRLVKLPTSRHIIAMLRRARGVCLTKQGSFFIRWYVPERPRAVIKGRRVVTM
jgi:hypothetical protein